MPHRDVYFVPIYLGYEQIIEERAYTAELAGEEKKKESITALIKTTKVLWSRYGRLYVNFAEPISCRELLEREQVFELPSEDPKFQTFLRRASYKVLQGINGVAMLTPSSVAAMALLMHPKRGVSRSVLLARVGFILDVAGRKRQPLSKTLANALRIRRQEVAIAVEALEASGQRDLAFALGEDNPVAIARGRAVEEVIDEALTRFVQQKHVEKHSYDDDTVFTPVPAKRINLDFYKNNIVHLFVAEALVAAAVRGEAAADGRAELAEVREAASFLGWIFKREFVYDPELDFDQQFDRTLLELAREGVLTLHRPEPQVRANDEDGRGRGDDEEGDETSEPQDTGEAEIIELHPIPLSLDGVEAVSIHERSRKLMELLHQVLEPLAGGLLDALADPARRAHRAPPRQGGRQGSAAARAAGLPGRRDQLPGGLQLGDLQERHRGDERARPGAAHQEGPRAPPGPRPCDRRGPRPAARHRQAPAPLLLGLVLTDLSVGSAGRSRVEPPGFDSSLPDFGLGRAALCATRS